MARMFLFRVEHGFASHRGVTITGHAGAGPVSPSPTHLHTAHPTTIHGLRRVSATAAATSQATGQTACQVSHFVVSFLFLFKFLPPPNIHGSQTGHLSRPAPVVSHEEPHERQNPLCTSLSQFLGAQRLSGCEGPRRGDPGYVKEAEEGRRSVGCLW